MEALEDDISIVEDVRLRMEAHVAERKRTPGIDQAITWADPLIPDEWIDLIQKMVVKGKHIVRDVWVEEICSIH